MAADAQVAVDILLMDRHFLYLPLYLAQFDHPASGKRPWFGKIPSNYSVELITPAREKDRTDKAVFDALMDARLGSSNIMFAACDPTVLLTRQDKNALIAASLIGSSAFWAVNHDARDVRVVSDLSSFDRILCYKEGTTSNLIARRIAKRDTNKLTVVETTDEIPNLEKLGEGTLAISPELLKIANLVYGPLRPGEKRAAIVLELCTSKEFSNVLTTALFTRAEVVDKHPKLVSGVLAALQSAFLAIHAGHPMVKECAQHNFRDAFHLDEALAIANNGNVFPETINVRRDRWQRACEFYYISQAIVGNREKNTLTKAEQRKSEDLYSQTVLDRKLRSLVTEAITRGFSESLESGNVVTTNAGLSLNRASTWLLGMAAAFTAGHLLAANVTPGAKIAMFFSWILMLFAGWVVGELFRYRKTSKGYVAHWAFFVLLWWALHELVVPRGLHDGHFIAGIAFTDGLAGGLLTVASAWVLGVGPFLENRGEAKPSRL